MHSSYTQKINCIELVIQEDLSYIEKTKKILDIRDKVLRTKTIGTLEESFSRRRSHIGGRGIDECQIPRTSVLLKFGIKFL